MKAVRACTKESITGDGLIEQNIPLWIKLKSVGLTSCFFTSFLWISTQDTLANMPVSRMRMRPWLENKIESNTIPGLTWVDKDKTMFSIPWKHAARHGWEMDKDASLFKDWAIHTGKYAEGKATDPKTWKANFRCALNSLPDIVEVKDKSINKGHQAVRVFKMLPYSPKCRESRSKAKETRQKKKSCVVKMEEESDYSDTQSPRNEQDDSMSTQENTVDSTVLTDGNDFPLMPLSEVPECSHSIEIGSESLSHRFEVSPEHSPEYSDFEEIIEICRQLESQEKELYCVPFTSLDNINLGNLTCTSPGSQWSESSSDESDEMPQYTTLGSDFILPTDESWKSFSLSFSQLL